VPAEPRKGVAAIGERTEMRRGPSSRPLRARRGRATSVMRRARAASTRRVLCSRQRRRCPSI
jgi:hypothetical protein